MYEMVFALSEMYKVRREYAIRFEASAFTFHVLGLRLYHGSVPRYEPKLTPKYCIFTSRKDGQVLH